ncbi:MAG: Pantoate kinase [Methanonatronarchaeales archaeon]|nr:Pantoate kinase [Methanonatronarchaeales archaeon]
MRATAWSPGHLSLLFRPIVRGGSYVGSEGAGVCIDRGVTTTVTDEVDGEPVHGIVTRVLAGLCAKNLHATHDIDVPVGAGFGTSGALALSTALAAAALKNLGYVAAVKAAHEAELACSTGLGDVAAQAVGGAVIRTEPGFPPHPSFDRVPAPPTRMGYLVLGERSTPASLLDVDALPELDRVLEGATLGTLFESGLSFSRRTGLTTPRVEAAVEAVEARGGVAAQVHLGETVVFTDAELEEAEGANLSPSPAHVLEVDK